MSVSVDESWIVAICETADAFGIDSVRAPLLALRCARAHAALHGRLMITEADAEVAAALVLAPRATRFPTPPEDAPAENEDASDAPPPTAPPEPPPAMEDGAQETEQEPSDGESEDERPTPPSSNTDVLRQAEIGRAHV